MPVHRYTLVIVLFFFNDTATTEIYTLSLHDALPICWKVRGRTGRRICPDVQRDERREDRKSTRLNSSHTIISYAVFCLKKHDTKWADRKASSRGRATAHAGRPQQATIKRNALFFDHRRSGRAGPFSPAMVRSA